MELFGVLLALWAIRLLFWRGFFERRDSQRIRWRPGLRDRHGRTWWLMVAGLALLGVLSLLFGL